MGVTRRKKQKRGVDMRWMRYTDIPAVLIIEQDGFADPWDEKTFMECLRIRNCIGMVITYNDEVVGYVIYELHDRKDGRPIEILNIAVHRDFQRMMLGTCMLDKLKSKLSLNRRRKIFAKVVETNLAAQLWFRANGFTCTSIERQQYSDEPELAAYKFEFYTTNDDGGVW